MAAVSGTQADVVAIMEIENDGYGAASAEQFLVDRLNEKDGAGTWAFIDADGRTDQVDALGNDAIKVGMLYKPDKVTPVGATAVLNSVAFVNAGTDGPKNRPALAQAFRDNSTGGIFVGVANHLKSKGSGCGPNGTDDDKGDGQGNCNGARKVSAQLLADWLATDPTGTGDPDVLILGDLNSYAKEDPITTLEAAGFTNLIEKLNGAEAYSYAFDGQWGYLDHALGTASITTQVTGVGDWHINADEPSVLDYNTEFKSASQVDLALRAGRVPHLRPRPGRRRARPHRRRCRLRHRRRVHPVAGRGARRRPHTGGQGFLRDRPSTTRRAPRTRPVSSASAWAARAPRSP